MHEFTTAVKEAEEREVEDGDVVEFKVDGYPCKAYRPTPSQFAFVVTATSRHTPLMQQIAGVINFIDSVMDEDGSSHLQARLLDRKDDFGIDEVRDILEWLIEQWSGRPTESSSGSTRSPRAGGQKSKRATTRSTSST